MARASTPCTIVVGSRKRRQWMRLGALSGLALPALVSLTLAVLTFIERGFLHDYRWSPIRRNRVEWPSLLELSDRGWLAIALFIAAGGLGLVFAASLWHTADDRGTRAAAFLIGLMSLAVMLEA
jgi:hypothetical protein